MRGSALPGPRRAGKERCARRCRLLYGAWQRAARSAPGREAGSASGNASESAGPGRSRPPLVCPGGFDPSLPLGLGLTQGGHPAVRCGRAAPGAATTAAFGVGSGPK